MDWRILERISPNFYILSHTQDTHMRYAPLYITSFPLNAPRKQLDAQLFQNRWGSYGAIDNIPDRLRWLRHSRGLMQKEAAQIAGLSRGVYIDLETGAAKQMPAEAADKLAAFYGVPATDLMDAYSAFLQSDPASQLLHHRTQLGLTREAFAQQLGTSVRNLQMWETGKRTISYKSWERCFAGEE